MYRNRAVTPSSPTIDIIPNRFVFSIIRVPPQSTNKVFYFSIDNDEQFIYQPFFADFGPLSLLQIHVFLIVALNHMADHQCLVHFYCSSQPQHVSNAVLLASAFRLIHMGMKADEAYKPFNRLISQMKPYRDASSYPSTYDLSVLSCIRGIERAMANGWYDPNTFDPQSWSDREQVENGDMNWLIPNKLLAFASPYSTNLVQGFRVCTPSDIVPTFKEIGITRIVRLNNKTYEENIFKEAGFIHTELFFPDGTCPPPQILQEFLNIIEGPDVVALHCKAGLGRTGTLAGCHMIKNFGFNAHEAIGWIRVCRPGSVIGPQQAFLIKYDSALHRPAPQTHVAPSIQHVVKSSKRPALSRPSDRINGNRAGLGTANSQSANSRTRATKTATASSPSRQRPKTTARPDHLRQNAKEKVSQQENGLLQIQAVSITPTVPQPRKLQRAQQHANSRKTPRK